MSSSSVGGGKKEVDGIGNNSEESDANKRLKMTTPPSRRRILYILTPQSLLGFQLDPDVPSIYPSPSPSPSFHTHINLLDKGFPIDMGFINCNSEILFFGGITRFARIPRESDHNLHVLSFHPSNGGGSLVAKNGGVSTLTACKRLPIVEKIKGGDKIFVHHLATRWFYNQPPLFECLHLPTGKWKTLPDSPGATGISRFHADVIAGFPSIDFYNTTIGYGHFVACNKIFFPGVSYRDRTYCFDMEEEKWDDSCAENLVSSFRKLYLELGDLEEDGDDEEEEEQVGGRVYLPLFGRSFSGLDERYTRHCSLILSTDRGQGRELAAHMVHKSGSLLLYQALDNLELYRGLEIGDVSGAHIILDLEDGKHMCFLSPLIARDENDDRWIGALYMCIFQVKILYEAITDIVASCEETIDTDLPCAQSREFIEAKIVQEHCYEIPEFLKMTPTYIRALIL